MCNKRIGILDNEVVVYNNPQEGAVCVMDTLYVTNSTPGSTASMNEEIPRVKLLCSFLGGIMPRPQDGKLRYVGGETRILTFPRDITYEELMCKAKEIYEGTTLLKYQQPEEDLDSLVSVVNDDDVTNMMEEYEKSGSGDGFNRLRIFLFSSHEQDGLVQYGDGDDRESERRYMDALNSFNDGAEIRRQQSESPLFSPGDEVHAHEQIYNPFSQEAGMHSQRSGDLPIPQYNMHHTAIPPQRYNEPEGQWAPAPSYYSPSPMPFSEHSNMSPSGPYGMQFGDIPERVPDENTRPQLNHYPSFDHLPQYSENVVWMPTVPISGEMAGFPGNLLHSNSFHEGNSARVPIHRSQLHLEQGSIGSGISRVGTPSYAESPPAREPFLANADGRMQHTLYNNNQNDHRPVYTEAYNYEIGWTLPHQSSFHNSGAGRFNDPYIVDVPGVSYPLGPSNLADGRHMPSSNYVHHQAGPEFSSPNMHDHAIAAPHHLHLPPLDLVQHENISYAHVPENVYPQSLGYVHDAHVSENVYPQSHGYAHDAHASENVYPQSHGYAHDQSIWRNVHSPAYGSSPYGTSPYATSPGTASQMNGSVGSPFVRGGLEGNQRIGAGMGNQHGRFEPSQKILGFDGTSAPTYSYGNALILNPSITGLENYQSFTPEPAQSVLSRKSSTETSNTNVAEAEQLEKRSTYGSVKEANSAEKVEDLDTPSIPCQAGDKLTDAACVETNNPENSKCASNSDNSKCAGESNNHIKVGEREEPSVVHEDPTLTPGHLSFLPSLMESMKKVAIEEAEEVKTRVEEDADLAKENPVPKETTVKGSEALDAPEGSGFGSDGDTVNTDRIEPTKAEAEAIERGLQTVKNDDLEEVRELGAGAYGSVYHGKWKGSDVAIKRIKASCFAGKPHERERLIADFWKEALLLGSLHHPNVVSFYGIVRDGPDGSLATVTEFMVNGSLKQFLQKKDRTIDRRKRLIIAMDAAFGMEYLHGKNIVHFDLKCENLLVNMRDPQRPVCKIGDLGLSKVKQHTMVSGGIRGTLPWMAPELLSGKNHMVTEKIDVYSFGVVMWELLTGEEPYSEMHCASIIGGIVNNTLRPQIPTWCDPEWKSLMESCWASDPKERPSFAEIARKLRSMAAAINVK
ncbi:hypothetical protein Tsubulata_006597 [Turnera subulata]|uniref:Protein kinase domain-containing protein n=1 Tax=Turnera subulata TaxID=218843 RepID=A0A9Q0J5S5_9ROSI|nr:hypothetical protein Tsubulata_006597 [Turnera subulata]